MSRLPSIGGDNNTWGDVLNDFLRVEHNSDGTLKNVVRPTDSRLTNTRTPTDGSVTDSKLVSTGLSASKIKLTDSGNYFTSTNTEAALAELGEFKSGGSRTTVAPSGDTTGATDVGVINTVIAAGKHPDLQRGQTYYTNGPITLNIPGATLYGNGAKLKRANQPGTTEWNQVTISAKNCRVYDLEFDGNKTNYASAGWHTTSEIYCGAGGDHSIVRGCYLHDFPGEGIQHGDCNDFAVIENWLQDGNGNGVHYGSSSGTWRGGRVLFNKIKNVNLNTAVGHADGCVVLSNGVGDLLVHGNYLENGIAGVSSIDQTDNGDITISNNEIRSMTGHAIEGDNPTGTSSSNVLIEGNRIYNSISVYVNEQASGSSEFPFRWVIRGNLFSNTAITGNYSRHVLIEGNTFTGGSTTLTYIIIDSAKWLTVAGNQFEDGSYATSVGTALKSISIRGNTCIGQYTRAINVYGAGATGANVIEGNTIESDAGSGASFDGISIGANQTKFSIKNNDIFLAGGNSGISVSGDNCIIQDNTVRHGSAAYSIRLNAGAESNLVAYNTTDVAVSDAGTTTTLTGNAVIV